MYIPTANGYFSGAGGMEIGLMKAGVEMVQSLDIDIEAINCMKRNKHYFSHKIVHSDIKNELVLEQPYSDVIVGTYPCTKYSAIADIHGTRTGDDLFLHFFRMVAIRKPEMYIVENVPGMRKFKVVMEAMTKLPGYYVNVFCPVNAINWLPQDRKRLLLIGTKKKFDITAPKPLRKRKSLRSIIENDPEIALPKYVINRLKGKYRDKPIIVDADIPGSFAPCCVAHYAKDMGTRLLKDKNAEYGVRPFTKREYARLQGFPDDFEFEDKLDAYRLIGNAVPIQMGEWLGKQAIKYFN